MVFVHDEGQEGEWSIVRSVMMGRADDIDGS